MDAAGSLEGQIRELHLRLRTTVFTAAKEAEVRAKIAELEATLAQVRRNAEQAPPPPAAAPPMSPAEIEVELRTLRWVLATLDMAPAEATKVHARIAERSADLARLRPPPTREASRPGPQDDDEDDDGPRRGGGYPSTTGRPSGGGRWND